MRHQDVEAEAQPGDRNPRGRSCRDGTAAGRRARPRPGAGPPGMRRGCGRMGLVRSPGCQTLGLNTPGSPAMRSPPIGGDPQTKVAGGGGQVVVGGLGFGVVVAEDPAHVPARARSAGASTCAQRRGQVAVAEQDQRPRRAAAQARRIGSEIPVRVAGEQDCRAGQPIAASTQRAQARTARSSPWRPTIWIPSGRPFGPVPAGTVTQGTCSEVQMKLNAGSPVHSRPFGASPGADGVTSTSRPSIASGKARWVVSNTA